MNFKPCVRSVIGFETIRLCIHSWLANIPPHAIKAATTYMIEITVV